MAPQLTWSDDLYVRAWHAFIGEPDEINEAVMYLRRFAEEAQTNGHKVSVEIWILKDPDIPVPHNTPVE